jgi:NADPH:quinone reductase-like Zn-dependent oxidoreductase
MDANARIYVTATGGPEQLKLIDAAMPVPGAGELLLRVEAVGVAFADVVMRMGFYPGVKAPFTPGYEVVGRVVAGEGFPPGTRVAALTVTGGYARYVAIPAADCAVVPDALTSPQAASLVLNGLTAFQMLTRCVARPSVRKMLVWGAAGGVGSLLLELGRHFGIETYGVASTGRLGEVAKLGGIPIDRSRGDVAVAVKRASGGGVDAVFDGVGGPVAATSFAALRPGGVVLLFGFQGGLGGGKRDFIRIARNLLAAPRKSAQSILLSGRGMRGYLVTDWKTTHPDFYRADLAEVFALAAQGRITPVIDRELPLARAAEAHRLIGAGRNLGKIILIP